MFKDICGTGGENTTSNRDLNQDLLRTEARALTTKLLRPDISTYSHTPVNKVN